MKSIIGEYGDMTDSLISEKSGSLSFRNSEYTDLNSWKKNAVNKVLDILSLPETLKPKNLNLKSTNKYDWDGLTVEELEWQLSYGPSTKALFLKPSNCNGKLPGILALHDHAGKKYWGYDKIARGKTAPHSLMSDHHKEYYDGLCWANELAKKGFGVLIHDTFPFASRRVHISEVSVNSRRGASIKEPVSNTEIEAYNDWAITHEHDMAKSLFSAGTTWPGVTLMEDQIALDVLSSRSDIDSAHLGCGGLSGGGMRTVFLGGLDNRIKCAVCAGFMTTWKDFSLYSAWTHTWMAFVPGLPGKIDFPEILGLRVPLPIMVLNNNDDSLYNLEEMRNADKMLKELYEKAGAEDKYRCSFYPGVHKFDSKMQKEAFTWFKKWLA
ncbi:MAG: hypothetical protein KAH95_09605 [Spirochaetales bacterium]|nr:hypothetical protein [Spirochaetales bacterium]